jgi:hypothetical protein
MTWRVVRRGTVIATVEAPTKLDALRLIAARWGDGVWLWEGER